MDRRIRASQMAAQRPDTAEEIRARVIRNEALALAGADVHTKFPALTPDNIDEALQYQEQRIAAWQTALEAIR